MIADSIIDGAGYALKLKPNSNFILFRKCGKGDTLSDGERGVKLDNGKELAFPTDYHETSDFAEIIKVGPDCKVFSGHEIGETILCREFSEKLICADWEKFEYWMDKEPTFPPLVFRDNRPIPMLDYVVVERDTTVFSEGVRLPDDAIHDSKFGTLIAVGPLPPKASVGDRVVVLPRFADCYEFETNGKTFVCIHRDEIAVIHE